MTTKLTEMLSIDFPLFAFSHCRDVVAAVTNAGGLGVFGTLFCTPEQLREELSWIEAHVNGRPYGIDLVMPETYVTNERRQEYSADELWKMIPAGHTRFAEDICDRYQVPQLAAGAEVCDTAALGWSQVVARQQLEVAWEFSPVLLVNALGVPPADVIAQAHAKGIKVGAQAGSVRHALKSKAAGVDVIIANGHEAAGHTGDITTMVLVPQVVKAVAPLPVLASGGIATGQQMAAAMVLGAQGAWTGTVWLSSHESELLPAVREKLLAATSEQTARTRCITGKPARHLVTPYTAAWDADDSPGSLPMPLQTMATTHALTRISRGAANGDKGSMELVTTPAGQVVGLIDQARSCRQIVQDFREGFVDALGRIDELMG